MSDLVKSLAARADAAMARGQVNEALAHLGEAIASGDADFDVLMKAATLYRVNQEPRKALQAVDDALGFEPIHFIALFIRASLLESLGDAGAGEAYGRALAQRETMPIPPAMAPALKHAEEFYRAYTIASKGQIDRAIEPHLAGASSIEGYRLRRFATNNARVTRAYHCEPTHFHYPGLAEYEFHDPSQFAWIAQMEAAVDVIRAEMLAVMKAEGAELVPYVQYADQVPMRQWKPLNNNLDWTAIHLLYQGKTIEENARHCPRTMEILRQCDQPRLVGNAPNAMFSLLKPGVAIPPHHGVANFRLVCHLPLIVPADCWFRVGAERRQWEEGKVLIFDDSIEHEAANESDDLRVVMIFDTWHPDLSPRERQGIAAALDTTPALNGLL